MTANRWIVLAGLVGLLWICPIFGRIQNGRQRKCFKNNNGNLFVADNYNGVISKTLFDEDSGQGSEEPNSSSESTSDESKGNTDRDACIIFLDKNGRTTKKQSEKLWPQIKNNSDSLFLLLSKFHIKREIQMHFLYGENCTAASRDNCDNPNELSDPCKRRCLTTSDVCETSTYSKTVCSSEAFKVQDKYIVNVTATEAKCINCDNPKKEPEEEIDLNQVMEKKFNLTINTDSGEPLDPVAAVNIMSSAADLASSINGSSAALNLAEGISGILMRETEPSAVDTVSFAYSSPNGGMNVIDDTSYLKDFTRSVTVPKQAFETALSLNVSIAFVAVMRFANMSKDASNSTVLDNQVLGVEMGAEIKNLTDKINITFGNLKYKGIPSCHSWNGEGNIPSWIDYGCETILTGNTITCQCSHLTFFAILLAPLNETISSSDLTNLTIITQVGCGLSMFFLGIILFMHFLLRKPKASMTTILLIQLVSALFCLNVTFLINNFVAETKNVVGCKIMAAVMHYFMLATFTWFAVQAFHLSLQLHTRGTIQIRYYVLKVSIISWGLPSIIGIILLITGKYGEQVIRTENTENDVAMCWITDSDAHYIVNIGYYAVIFLFTFTAFVIIMSWLVCLKKTKAAAHMQLNKTGISMMTVLGLCCMLGITWGFAFFAQGVFRVPAYYIFTILNSFQGFFLFIYYTSTSQSTDMNTTFQSTSTNTLKLENPFADK